MAAMNQTVKHVKGVLILSVPTVFVSDTFLSGQTFFGEAKTRSTDDSRVQMQRQECRDDGNLIIGILKVNGLYFRS